MDFIIGTKEDFKKFSFNKSEREELIRMKTDDTMRVFYHFIIDRLNEFEISIIEDSFRCESINQTIGFNHLACLLRRDLIENSNVKMSLGLSTKLIKVFLSALRDYCVSDGVVELDAQDVLGRFQSRFQQNEAQRKPKHALYSV